MKTNIVKNTLAIILGGGAGTRLFPLTANRSKPAVSIAGKYRLVDIPISNCMNSDVLRMFVVTQFNSASLNTHIKNTYQFSLFSKAFVDILAAEQTPDNNTWFQGTADAVRQCLHHLQEHSFEYVLILSGDQLYQMDFRLMLDNHIAKNADISIATIPVDEKDAPEFGIMKVNEKGIISSFIEKPKANILKDWISNTGKKMQEKRKHYLASMGIYIFNKKLLFELLEKEMKDATDFGKEIIPNSVNKYTVASYQYEGYWTDIGNIYSFYEANLALTEEVPDFNLFDTENTIYTRPRMLPPSKINGTTLEKTMVADGCIVQAKNISHSVIGIRTRIGEMSEINDSYIMGADEYETLLEIQELEKNGKIALGIGKRCKIFKAIIDKNCRIGNDVIIKGGTHLANTEHELYTIKDGIIVVKKGAVIPNNTIIE
ncbi:MAG: glucose-1-phosphate adenylyltransferase [Bacteroidetes bacterium]|nr:MAG: glucose-1-phosphate adenylyltransferase [Bacteroidota bacterium]TAG88803.1 MAG: glucose-1-phosphate adenylyltransferase [Bacteroidota bacterium]